jgi:hypothetical protein
MQRWPLLCPLACAAVLGGCASTGGGPSADPTTAQLEFVKSHPRSDGFTRVGAERFAVTQPGKFYRWDVYLYWASADSQTRPVLPGDLHVYGSAEQAIQGKVRTCHARIGFHVEAGRSYQIKLDHPFETGECTFTVRDKASGEFLPLRHLD